MRVATFSIAGERRVGLVDLDAETIAPFDFPVEQAEAGILALIERDGAGLPRTLSPMPLSQRRARSADPAAAPQHLLRRQELSRACA